METAIAERNIGLVEDGGAIYTPPNIQPNVAVVMCWNSTDINEETLRAMVQPTTQMESSYRELFSLVVLWHLNRVLKIPVLEESERGNSLLSPAGFCHTLLEHDAVLARWPSVMKT